MTSKYERAAERYRRQKIDEQLVAAFERLWTDNPATRDAPVDRGYPQSITTWGSYGLRIDDFEGFVDVVESKGDSIPTIDRWRYFCGCCWNMVRAIKEMSEDDE